MISDHLQTSTQDDLERLVESHGLLYFGVAPLGPEKDFEYYSKWLERGYHAGMAYMERHSHCRQDPRELLAGAKSALIFGLGYYLGDTLRTPKGARIAQYARLRDYHKVLWRRGEDVARKLLSRFEDGGSHRTRVVVDSVPILERALAARAGAGFIGKNTCFIHPRKGSFYLLGEVLTTLELPQTTRHHVDPHRRTVDGGCGSCRRCQVHCPTGALDEAWTLDANKCLSYWTIEHRGPIPQGFWPWLRHFYYGCDICQLVCPYNRKQEPAHVEGLLKWKSPPSLFEVATMDQRRYERLFGGTPMTRAKRVGLMRNALIAMTVTNDARLDDAVQHVARSEVDETLHETLRQISSYCSESE